VGAHVFHPADAPLQVTISIGVATAPSDRAGTVEGVIREADKALYRAKSAGRNRTA
jgi:diguanylate cyclase (GGDEF)-like protein